ncbi:MAG: PQQ-dependent sugar dehydrogenase [Acidobacteria bacterium]|nr:PQQ-dependent sugar dehydrogenase [Acidobacteriota bacterium]
MRALVVAIAAVLILVGCSDDDTSPTTEPSTTPDTVDLTESTAEHPATSANTDSLQDVTISTKTVAVADQPIVMRPHPDGSVWIAQRTGSIVELDLDAGTVSTPVLDLSEEISTDGERGLLGMAFDPSGERIYVHYSGLDGATNLVSFAFDPDGIDMDTRAQHLLLEQPFPTHNGGDLHFGTEGLLYMALGDGGLWGDPQGNGQNTDTLLGSVLRLSVDGTEGYQISEDNPFADGGGRPEIFLYGVRNPWRFDIDETTGDLWIADVGQGEVEEITHLGAGTNFGRGANLGWALREGSEPYDGGESPEDEIAPIFEYSHDRGCSITGGYVYRGDAIAGLEGAYVYADYCEGAVHAVTPAGEDRALGAEFGPREIISFGVGSDGELFVLQASGPIVALLPGQ